MSLACKIILVLENLVFLPGLTSLGDLLDQQEYNQTFIMDSDATFGGRRAYLSQHGGYHLVDLYEARRKNYIPADYDVWWSYEDEKLFSIAKKRSRCSSIKRPAL